jgi:hypothetical protein
MVGLDGQHFASHFGVFDIEQMCSGGTPVDLSLRVHLDEILTKIHESGQPVNFITTNSTVEAVGSRIDSSIYMPTFIHLLHQKYKDPFELVKFFKEWIDNVSRDSKYFSDKEQNYYAPVVPICQRSGDGKTRLMLEIGMSCYPMIYIHLGDQLKTSPFKKILDQLGFYSNDPKEVQWGDEDNAKSAVKNARLFYLSCAQLVLELYQVSQRLGISTEHFPLWFSSIFAPSTDPIIQKMSDDCHKFIIDLYGHYANRAIGSNLSFQSTYYAKIESAYEDDSKKVFKCYELAALQDINFTINLESNFSTWNPMTEFHSLKLKKFIVAFDEARFLLNEDQKKMSTLSGFFEELRRIL